MKKQKIIAITGSTASGKSDLAVLLAKNINGEIISADSRLIYSYFNIAAAKPSEEEKQGIPHHMMSIIDPVQEYSAAEFSEKASSIIKDIAKKHKVPIVAGGTGLYFRLLLENYAPPKVAPNKELRQQLEKETVENLYKKLIKLDKTSAEKIHANNKVKIIRALEVCLTLNKPMSLSQGKKDSEYDVLWIGLSSANREFLYKRIEQRVDIMVEKGLAEEAKALYKKYGGLNILKNTIGYKELIPYFDKQCTLEEAVKEIKQNTRRYAKRQLSWFRANPKINWFDIEKQDINSISEDIQKLWINFLESENCL